jgi:dihydroneopterin aldolase
VERLLLEGLEVSARIGVPEEERAAPQPLWIDVELDADLSLAGGGDDPAETVDYQAVYNLVIALAAEKPRRLIEALAREAAERLLVAFPDVKAATVRVWKRPATMPQARRVAAEFRREKRP